MRVVSVAAIVAIVLAGCGPEQKKADPNATVNAGVNIVPQAILASEKITPSTHPADDTRPDLIQVLSQSRQPHQMLLRGLRVAGLVPMLREKGPITLFAPTDEAFGKLPPGTMDRLLAHPDELRTLLQYHIITGRILYRDLLQTNGRVQSLLGPNLVIRGIDNKVMVNDANVIESESSASNGVIHWIDGVLLPPT